MNAKNRDEVLDLCLKSLPKINESTKKIITEIIYQKNALGQYLVKDEKDIKSLIEYISNSETNPLIDKK